VTTRQPADVGSVIPSLPPQPMAGLADLAGRPNELRVTTSGAG
jgi:hypothetical protein